MSAIAASNPAAPLEPSWPNRTDDAPPAAQRLHGSSQWWHRDAFWRLQKCANVRRRRISLVLAVPLAALFGLVDFYVAPDAYGRLWLIRFGILTPAILALLAFTVVNPLHRWSEVSLMLGVVVAGGCVTAMSLIAPSHFAGILLVVIASYTFLGLPCVHASSAGLSIGVLYVIAAVVDGTTQWPMLVANVFFLLSCNVIGAFACYALEQAARRQFSHKRALSEQRQVSERLLHHVLPVSVAQRLKTQPGAIADAYPDATILFADIVDFTRYAATVTPARLVQLLDEVFTRFDRLAQKHGLEKIKTIGDAYMVAGGLRAHDSDHVHAVADMALDMLDAVRAIDPGNGLRLALRIGIHTGPVVAGVIGRTKFTYDLWGDTVNVASRLENLTMPGTIQVSEATCERLRDRYVFSPRRVIAVKGRGEMPCYLLLGRGNPNARAAGSAVAWHVSRPIRDALVGTVAPSPGACPA